MNFWDQKYNMPDYKYGKLPNQFLQEQQVRLRPASEALAWEGEVMLTEGTGHQGSAYVTRYVAQWAAS